MVASLCARRCGSSLAGAPHSQFCNGKRSDLAEPLARTEVALEPGSRAFERLLLSSDLGSDAVSAAAVRDALVDRAYAAGLDLIAARAGTPLGSSGPPSPEFAHLAHGTACREVLERRTQHWEWPDGSIGEPIESLKTIRVTTCTPLERI